MRVQLLVGCATAGLLAAAGSAHAAAPCTPAGLNALGVADVNVTEAKPVAATAQQPAYCQVLGTVVTRGGGAPDGSARFSLQLPDAWKQRYLFVGVGGNAGNLQPSANGVDRAAALGKGYAMILTDTGHIGDGTTAKWVRKPDGSRDEAKVVDFFNRAAHNVSVAGKAFAQAYYGAPVLHAYFDGCSTGGRMALVSAQQYPDDYAGIIAGDPAMDFKLALARWAIQKAALRSPDGYMSPQLLEALDTRITARCDAIDGAKDGMVQDPLACPVKPEDLRCKAGETKACLDADQVKVLRAYLTPIRDRRGKIVYPNWPITNLFGRVGANSYTFGQTKPDITQARPWGPDERAAPRGWELGHQSLSYWLGDGEAAPIGKVDIDENNVAGDALLARFASYAPGDATDPAKMKAFIDHGHKLILYHGSSDPSIPWQRTIQFYNELAKQQGGFAKTQSSVRFFLVPGMHHCGGGVGPDKFDTLSALEAWVEQGQAPATIMASTLPDAPVQRNLPLCPYPAQARYNGKGELSDAANWSCKAPAAARKAKPAKAKAAV